MNEHSRLPVTFGLIAACVAVYVAVAVAGQAYGYRVAGPWDPGRGMRYNPAKLLLDPYGKAVDGQVRWDRSLYSCLPDGDGARPTGRRRLESAAGVVPRETKRV